MSVRIRMYCVGLGDCFLLTFAETHHVLIDCGSLNSDAARLRGAVEDIRKETAGKIDLLIVSNEHWDHVSGFTQARGQFDKIEFGEIWLSWTEDPNDPEAVQFRAHNAAVKDALRLAPTARELLAFLGANTAAVAFSDATREAMDYVRARMQRMQTRGRYCQPGEAAAPFGAGVRFHVLGPARTQFAIAGASASTSSDPFDEAFRAEPSSPAHGEDDWRRIDNDWQGAAAGLALRLDNDMNNASLALAIELESGDVLLFPGDTQAAGWANWPDPRLLARTVFYKASHHGSDAGTPRRGGLDLMTNLRHVMIPADEKFAGTWQMPSKALLAALDEKSRHSVDRSDRGDALWLDWYL